MNRALEGRTVPDGFCQGALPTNSMLFVRFSWRDNTRGNSFLLPTQKILSHILHGIVQCIAGIAWGEAKFAARLVVIEVSEVFRHLDFVSLHRRRKVPLAEQRIDYLRAGDREL